MMLRLKETVNRAVELISDNINEQKEQLIQDLKNNLMTAEIQQFK